MKQNGKYRFSLQFKADSNANIAAGELLERLGNRKSAVVVAALNDYISVHPEIAAGATRISVRIESEVKRESLEEMIRALIDEKIAAGVQILNVSGGKHTAHIVRMIRERYPLFPIMATGGPTEESIMETIEAGANAITYTPPSNGMLFSKKMQNYRAIEREESNED